MSDSEKKAPFLQQPIPDEETVPFRAAKKPAHATMATIEPGNAPATHALAAVPEKNEPALEEDGADDDEMEESGGAIQGAGILVECVNWAQKDFKSVSCAHAPVFLWQFLAVVAVLAAVIQVVVLASRFKPFLSQSARDRTEMSLMLFLIATGLVHIVYW